MTNTQKGIFWVYVASCFGFYWLGGELAPEKVKIVNQIKTEKVVEEKIRIKTVTKKLPSGEIIITKVYQNDKKSKEKTKKDVKKVIDKVKPQWSVAFGRSLSQKNRIAVDRRIVGPFSAGVSIDVTDQLKVDKPFIYVRWEF